MKINQLSKKTWVTKRRWNIFTSLDFLRRKKEMITKLLKMNPTEPKKMLTGPLMKVLALKMRNSLLNLICWTMFNVRIGHPSSYIPSHSVMIRFSNLILCYKITIDLNLISLGQIFDWKFSFEKKINIFFLKFWYRIMSNQAR